MVNLFLVICILCQSKFLILVKSPGKVLEFAGKSWKSPGIKQAKVLKKQEKCPGKSWKALEFGLCFSVATLGAYKKQLLEMTAGNESARRKSNKSKQNHVTTVNILIGYRHKLYDYCEHSYWLLPYKDIATTINTTTLGQKNCSCRRKTRWGGSIWTWNLLMEIIIWSIYWKSFCLGKKAETYIKDT